MKAAWAALALGLASWLLAPAIMDIGYDGSTYVATGHGWARTQELVLAWGDVLTFWSSGAEHSHHFPPAYSFYLGLVFSAFGYGLAQAKLAALAASFLALAIVYLASRDLYGHHRALVVASLFALSPWMLWVTGMGFSESLALLFFALTMWAIVRSLTDERFIVLAGLFAGAAYLARASMGAFFVIAGGAGFAWRLYHRGWRSTLSSPWYALAILVFGGILVAWGARNVALFGWPNWETSPGSRGIPEWIATHKLAFLAGILVRAPLLALVYAPLVILLWPEAKRSLARIRDEHTSGLWLAAGLVWALGLLFAAAYFSMGPTRHEALRLDNARYVLVGVLPLAWALAREADLTSPSFRRRFVALMGALAAGSLLVVTFPAQYLPAQAGRALDAHLLEGDDVVIAGAGKYAFYASLTDPYAIDVYNDAWRDPADPPEFIIALYGRPQATDGYTLLASKSQPHRWWPASPDHVEVWGRDDVIAARSIELAPLRAGW